ncbi:MAG: chromophore lyase CpcT/CpeT [Planctomycetota bacterium]
MGIRNTLLVAAAATTALAAGCRSRSATDAETLAAWEPSPALVDLADWLSGHFTSGAQATRDDRFLNIELRAVRIWPERTDGIWLYVEQAAAWALDRPYRQRVYHLEEVDAETWRSTIRLLPTDDPLDLAGAWAEPSRFGSYDPADAEVRTGCGIELTRRDDGVFVGRTSGRGCESAIGDAVYATSSVLIRPDLVLSWDRGWTKNGQQAWGAESGPYAFERQ